MAKHVVGRVEEFPEGGRRLVSVDGRPVVIFRLGEEWFGLSNRCPHMGGDLCEGKLISLMEADRPGEYRTSRANEILRCPWHGWEFDIRTGRSQCDPLMLKARKIDVALVDEGEIEEVGDLETFPVSESGRYVVVEM